MHKIPLHIYDNKTNENEKGVSQCQNFLFIAVGFSLKEPLATTFSQYLPPIDENISVVG
jgi:hypothetical protein